MSTEQTTGEIKATREVKTVSISKERSWALILLMFLILVEIGGMAMLCYKFENPTATLKIVEEQHVRGAENALGAFSKGTCLRLRKGLQRSSFASRDNQGNVVCA